MSAETPSSQPEQTPRPLVAPNAAPDTSKKSEVAPAKPEATPAKPEIAPAAPKPDDASPNAVELFTEDKLGKEYEKAMGEIDRAFANLKEGSVKSVEQYEFQKAQAITAYKKYIIQSYDDLQKQAKNLDTVEGRKEWETMLATVRNDVNSYIMLVASDLTHFEEKVEARNKSKDMGGAEMWELAQKGNEIYVQLLKNKKYKVAMEEALSDKMSPESYEFLYNRIYWSRKSEKSPQGSDVKLDAVRLMDQAGITSVMATMSGEARYEFGKYLITGNAKGWRTDTVLILRSLVGSNLLTMKQGEDLVNLAIEHGVLMEGEKETLASHKEQLLADMLQAQEHNDAWRREIGVRLDQPMDKNVVYKVFDPKFLGGLFMVARSGVNLFATTVAYRKNYGELLTSPYVYADIAMIFTGSWMMGNRSIGEFLKQKSKDKIDKEGYEKRMAKLLTNADRYHLVSERYMEKDGMAEAITEVKAQHKKEEKKTPPTIEEIIAQAKRQHSDELAHDLEKLDNKVERQQLETLIAITAESDGIETTRHYREMAGTIRDAYKKKDETEKPKN